MPLASVFSSSAGEVPEPLFFRFTQKTSRLAGFVHLFFLSLFFPFFFFPFFSIPDRS